MECEDLARVVQRLAEGIGRSEGELFADAAIIPGLQRMVYRLCAVEPGQYACLRQDAAVACARFIQRSRGRVVDARANTRHLRFQSRRDQVREPGEVVDGVSVEAGRREPVQQCCELRIGYRLLEEAHSVGAQVPDLEHIVLVDLALNAE